MTLHDAAKMLGKLGGKAGTGAAKSRTTQLRAWHAAKGHKPKSPLKLTLNDLRPVTERVTNPP